MTEMGHEKFTILNDVWLYNIPGARTHELYYNTDDDLQVFVKPYLEFLFCGTEWVQLNRSLTY